MLDIKQWKVSVKGQVPQYGNHETQVIFVLAESRKEAKEKAKKKTYLTNVTLVTARTSVD